MAHMSQEAILFRIAHTIELIETFRGYCSVMPEHKEYYESVVEHLEVILNGYAQLMETPNVTH